MPDRKVITDAAPRPSAHPAGLAALVAHLGEATAAPETGAWWSPETVTTPTALVARITRLRDELVLPIECPAIVAAWKLAAGQQLRELLELDRRLNTELAPHAIREASRRVGRMHLRRLRPLHDQRLLRRYGETVHRGEAHGWHTLVYGIALHTYSLPLRQGLAAYTQQTLGGFLDAAGRNLHLPDEDRADMLLTLTRPIADAMQPLLPSGPFVVNS